MEWILGRQWKLYRWDECRDCGDQWWCSNLFPIGQWLRRFDRDREAMAVLRKVVAAETGCQLHRQTDDDVIRQAAELLNRGIWHIHPRGVEIGGSAGSDGAATSTGEDKDSKGGSGKAPPPKRKKPVANIHAKLVHSCDQSPLAKGKLKISGPDTQELGTSTDGRANFDGITPGSYDVEGTHPTHHPNTVSTSAPDGSTVNVTVPLKATIEIKPAKADYTVVLDDHGNATTAHPILEFQISKGPPNHFIDIQLSRHAAADLTGGPGLGGAWVEADGRDARMKREIFSSWSNGQKTLKTDGSGNATFKMPLEWWRDQARHPRASFTQFTYSYRVIAFKDASTPVCTFSSADGAAAPSVILRNNLVDFRVVDLGYINGGTAKSIRMEFKVREANTTNMYTFVQWKLGGREIWSGTPAVMTRPNVKDYNVIHQSTYPVSQLDRVGTNPRYWDGTYTISGDKLTASATDAPNSSLSAGATSSFTHIDFDTRVHLNFEVPANVTVTRQDGSPPVYGVVVGVLANPQPITLDSGTWNTRVLLVRNPDGTVAAPTHPATYAGP